MADEIRDAIHAVLLEYARGVDRADLDLVLAAFHPDATADHGAGFVGNAHEAWIKRLGSDPDPMDRVGIGDFVEGEDRLIAAQHHISNHLVKVHPGEKEADSEAYFVAYYLTERQGVRYLATVGGRYVDRFEQRDGRWRILRRASVHDWDKVDVVEHGFPNGERWVQGRRNRSDPSYG